MMLSLHELHKFPLCLLSLTLTCFFWTQVFGQGEHPSSIDRIKEAYNQFDYPQVVSLALQALEAEPPPLPSEQVEIYTYRAFAYVALGKWDEAKQDLETALELDPALTLDPVYVSPKIIALFEEVKSAKAAAREREPAYAPSLPSIEKDIQAGGAWRSLILPGWGQLYKGHKRKAIAFFALHTINVGTLVYAQLKMEQARDEYREARVEPDIELKYDRYNTFYKLRNYVALSTAAIWLLAHIDAALTSPARESKSEENERASLLAPKITSRSISLTYVVRF